MKTSDTGVWLEGGGQRLGEKQVWRRWLGNAAAGGGTAVLEMRSKVACRCIQKLQSSDKLVLMAPTSQKGIARTIGTHPRAGYSVQTIDQLRPRLMSSDNNVVPGRLQRMILRALFESGFRRRRRNVDDSTKPPEGPLPPLMRTATTADLAAGAVCRFCFEADDGDLVAPCACIGTQEWVHVVCLRKWQRVSLGSYEKHDSICNVCKAPFALPPPPLPKSRIRAGMLLVATEALMGTFSKSVILLCEVTPEGAHGVVINRPVNPAMSGPLQSVEAAAGRHGPLPLEWRSGGPVCGGRMGIVNYTVLHTVCQPSRGRGNVPSLAIVLPQGEPGAGAPATAPALYTHGAPIRDDYHIMGRNESSSEPEGDDEDAEEDAGEVAEPVDEPSAAAVSPSSASVPSGSALPLTAGSLPPAVPSVQVVVDRHGPASWSSQALIRVISRLGKTVSQGRRAESDATKAICFVGYCRWGRNQLQGEIHRGSWGMCNSTVEDVLSAEPGLWDALRTSGRLIDLP